ncbi:MAG: M28 family peptidase [Phycisphaeraceae bacterium]|nr:M28 family peptidase [Phycisphaeraceae bacterium]
MLITVALAVSALAQPSFPSSAYPDQLTNAYIRYEAQLQAVPTRDSLLAWHQLLGSEPHIAGTPGDLRTIERLSKAFADMGLDVQRHEFWALLAMPISASIQVVSPDRIDLAVKEDMLPEDEFSGHPDQMIGWNAYSGSGDVTANVVYANYGSKADFQRLAELGVDCTGKIVVCRYGGNYRGYKAKFAEEAGAAGVIIYSDPADSGFVKGPAYPEGGYANSTCIERGSLSTLGYNGDPLTPGWEATKDAPRLDVNDVALPRIPVQPVGWAAAEQVLKRMGGEPVPEGWKGGLPIEYRVTGGPDLRVRLKVQQERRIIPTANVIATLKGSTMPDEWMIIGCHHDAWNCGAADPLAGTIALMEAAKAFAELAAKGARPSRSIIFAAWGAEEFGIIGSSEWVEANRDELIRKAVAYINLDMASMGPDFNASTTPSLRRLIVECAKTTPQPRDNSTTVFQAWLARGEDPLFPGQPRFGDMGGGSDHVGFLCHIVMPCTSLGGGGSKGTSYHSTYDTLPWYWKVVGDDYEPALMTTRMTIGVAARVASSPIIPLELARYGPEIRRQLTDLTRRGKANGMLASSESDIASSFASLAEASLRFEERAKEVQTRLAVEVAKGAPRGLDAINRAILRAERAWRSEEGIPGRPWFQSLLAASDEDSGYASWPLPGLRYCIERKNADLLAEQIEKYHAVFRELRRALDDIESALSKE